MILQYHWQHNEGYTNTYSKKCSRKMFLLRLFVYCLLLDLQRKACSGKTNYRMVTAFKKKKKFKERICSNIIVTHKRENAQMNAVQRKYHKRQTINPDICCTKFTLKTSKTLPPPINSSKFLLHIELIKMCACVFCCFFTSEIATVIKQEATFSHTTLQLMMLNYQTKCSRRPAV